MSPPQALRVTVPAVKVEGSPLAPEWADLMTSVVLEMELQLPARLTVRFFDLSDERDLDLPFSLGRSVSISFPSLGGEQVVLGDALVVTEVAIERDLGGTPEIVVVAEDRSHLLAHGHRVATYLDMSASDIVRKLGSEVGLRVDADSTSECYPYVLQSDTDLGFLTTLARRAGFDWWVAGRTLHFKAPATVGPPVEVTLHEDLISLSVRTSSVPTQTVEVRGWDSANTRAIVGTATPPSRPPVAMAGSSGSALQDGHPLTTAQVRPESQAEAEHLATSIAARQTASATEADGEVVGRPTIVPRALVRVTSRAVKGDFAVTRCEHRFTAADGYTTRFVAGDRSPHSLADLLGGGGGVASAHGAFEGFAHLGPAVVTQIGKDDNLGRVKVQLPYMSEIDESHWARVLSAGGGPERGFWFLPEVGDEVLVAFEGGDPRFPVVLGGLYGKVSTPQGELLDGNMVARRAVRSRLGHVLELADGADDTTRHVLIGLGKDGKAGTDYRMRLGEDRFDLELPQGKPIAIKSGTSQITITDKGAISISADEITIAANKSLSIDSPQIKVTAAQEISIATKAGSSVKVGPAGVQVQGKPSTTIKGSPQIMIG